MSYEEFTTRIIEYFTDYFGDTAKVSLRPVPKNNGVVLDALLIAKKDINITPTIYLNMFYENYEVEEDFEEICREILSMYERHQIREDIDFDFYEDYERVKKHLGFKLISYGQNAELLKDLPHKRFLDLAVTFFCYLDCEKLSGGCIQVRKEHLEQWKITEEELFEDARQNAGRIFPPSIRTIREVLQMTYPEEFEEAPMFVLSNQKGLFGAGAILYENVLSDFANVVETDFYVLPSSIHEVLLLPALKELNLKTDYLNRVVREVNNTTLCREDILSDHAYLYLKESGELLEAA